MTSMPQTVATNQSDTDTDAFAEEVVLGVDTHKDTHVAAVVTVLGRVIDSKAFPTTTAGYRSLLGWARGLGLVRRAGVECTGSYGAGLTRYLLTEGVEVVEVNHPDKATRRRRGKTDTIDAQAAAQAVISGRATATAKTGDGPAEMVRMLKLAKDSAVKARTQAINQLKAVLVSADAGLRDSLASLTTPILIRRCAGLAPTDEERDGDTADVARYTLALLATRIQRLTSEVDELNRRLTAVIGAHTPRLLERMGIGPDNAAALLITAGDNPDRLGTEASFAALCGTSPVEASSGKTQRMRLNYGGDRQANAALYRIVLTRLRWHAPTRAYRDRRLAEGKTRREIIRCLKRYVAREVYPLLRPAPGNAEQQLPAAA
ncbi:transposase [Kribbella sp. VKM Ac-2527]|uniref:Transposase n=1 Tax=Kribbella caucasensis TaxID=2512215 RepID=A0A4R6K6G1_9ACTN|nr:IS110 family transposase [Kribbella sp. VKM Ac-2527]TDO44510.1 transposase [Kribbella sp. VKM Ac-2527]